jgi:hypothetical protein
MSRHKIDLNDHKTLHKNVKTISFECMYERLNSLSFCKLHTTQDTQMAIAFHVLEFHASEIYRCFSDLALFTCAVASGQCIVAVNNSTGE